MTLTKNERHRALMTMVVAATLFGVMAFSAKIAIGAQLLLTFSLRWVDAMTVGVISQLAVLISLASAPSLSARR